LQKVNTKVLIKKWAEKVDNQLSAKMNIFLNIGKKIKYNFFLRFIYPEF